MAKTKHLIIGGKKEDPSKWNTPKLIDAIGELDTKIKTMKKYKDLLRDTLVDREGQGTFQGSRFEVKLSEALSYEYDNLAIFNRLKKDKYVQCSKVSVTAVKEYIAPAELQEMILQVKSTIKMYVKKLDK